MLMAANIKIMPKMIDSPIMIVFLTIFTCNFIFPIGYMSETVYL